jgi:hypothetical protein
MANDVVFQNTTVATVPVGTIVETEDQGGGVQRQVMKAVFDQTSPGTSNGVVSGGYSIVWREADGIKTRPTNTLAYAANQLIGASGDCIFKFTDFFRKPGNTGRLTGLRMTAQGNGITAANMGSVRVYLYKAPPALTINSDQLTFNTFSGNNPIGLGYIHFLTWNIGGGSSDLIESYGQPVISPLAIAAADGVGDLYAVAVAMSAFTPLSRMVLDMFASAIED